jgi:hypothetical protein
MHTICRQFDPFFLRQCNYFYAFKIKKQHNFLLMNFLSFYFDFIVNLKVTYRHYYNWYILNIIKKVTYRHYYNWYILNIIIKKPYGVWTILVPLSSMCNAIWLLNVIFYGYVWKALVSLTWWVVCVPCVPRVWCRQLFFFFSPPWIPH